ncbi:MAG: hypothetical protein ACKVS8_10720 [Phycisphaerales bacterium]
MLLGSTARGRFMRRVRSVPAYDLAAEIEAAQRRGDYSFAFALEDRDCDWRAFIWGGGA